MSGWLGTTSRLQQGFDALHCVSRGGRAFCIDLEATYCNACVRVVSGDQVEEGDEDLLKVGAVTWSTIEFVGYYERLGGNEC